MNEISAQRTATRPWTLAGLLGLAIAGFTKPSTTPATAGFPLPLNAMHAFRNALSRRRLARPGRA